MMKYQIVDQRIILMRKIAVDEVLTLCAKMATVYLHMCAAMVTMIVEMDLTKSTVKKINAMDHQHIYV